MTLTASADIGDKRRQAPINKFRHNFNEKLRGSSKIIVLLSALHFCGSPMIMIGALWGNHTGRNEWGNDAFWAIAAFTAIISVILCVPTVIGIFRYMYKKPCVDMEMSLPLSTGEKFFSDLSAAAFVNIVPFLANQIIAIILWAVGYGIFEGKTIYINEKTNFVIISEFFGKVKDVYWQIMFGILAVIAMLIVMTLFIMVCCGSLFEIITYLGLFNILIPNMFYIFPAAFSVYSVYRDDVTWPYNRTSPLGGAIAVCQIISGFYMRRPYNDVLADYFMWILPMVIVTAVFSAAAFFLYRNRKAEQAGQPFAYKMFLSVTEFGTMLILSTYIYKSQDIGNAAMAICALIIIIMELTANRKNGNLIMSAVKLGSMAAVIAAVIAVSETTGGFGAMYKVPKLKDIEYAELYISKSKIIADSNGIGSINMTSEEDKQLVIDLQKDLIQFYDDSKNELNINLNHLYQMQLGGNSSGLMDIDITYHLRSGRIMKRYYYFDAAAVSDHKGLERTEGYLDTKIEAYRKEISEWGEISAVVSSELYVRPWSYAQPDQKLILDKDESAEFTRRLADALETDLRAETDEQYYSRPLPIVTLLFSQMIYDPHESPDLRYRINIPVYSHFKNTIAVLSEKIDIPEYFEMPRSGLDMCIMSPGEIKNSDTERIQSDTGYTKTNDFDTRFSASSPDTGRLYFDYLKDKLSEDEFRQALADAQTLISNSYSVFRGEGEYYKMNVYGWDMVIPHEYEDIAERLKQYEMTLGEYFQWSYEKNSY